MHKDAQRFFDRCEKWSHGEPLPLLTLKGMVDLLENNQQIRKSLTCPFGDFYNENKKTPGGGGGGKRTKDKEGDPTKLPQPTTNPTIPPLCVSAVNKLQSAHLGWTIPRFATKRGMTTHQFLVGANGGCSNYQLLGICKNKKCGCKHVACTVADTKKKEVSAQIFEGLR